MDVNEYQARALAMEADQRTLLEHIESMSIDQRIKALRLNNACRGLADECGELNGAVKKWLEYRQPLDEANVLEEVGDCLWRLAQVCGALGTTLSLAMLANLRKLEQVRYKGKPLTPERAVESGRDRQAERRAIEDAQS